MGHDVYICCDEREKELGDAIYSILEENNIKSWIKSKDFSLNDSVDKITQSISDSKCFILVLTKKSKDLNYVITETDIAFSREIPIIIYNIDNAKLVGNLEFILETQRHILSFPNTKKQLELLVKETSKIVDKPISNLKINSKYLGVIDKYNPKRTDNNVKKIFKVVIPLAIVLILIYLFVIVPIGQNTTESGIFTMNIMGVDVSPSASGYTYTVHGESYNMPSDSVRYFMNLQFFDENEDMVYEVNSTADEFKSGIVWSGDLKDDSVTHIGFKLTDMDDKILSTDDYKIK